MKVWLIIGLYFLPVLAWSQETPGTPAGTFEKYVQMYLATDNRTDISTEALKDYLALLEKKQASFKSDVSFLRYLFGKTHSKFLKEYRDYATFSELLTTGRYNCLTGTAFYALLLDYFRYDFNMVETNYHIFLQVNLDGRQILFETTDPLEGFVTDEKEVAERIALYRENKPTTRADKRIAYQFSFSLFNRVTLEQVTGLLYYNQAIDAFNRQELPAAVVSLNKATRCYKSPRISEFSRVILTALIESDLNSSLKQAYAQKISAAL